MPKKRIYAYDFIRAVAIIMVVAVHCIPNSGDGSRYSALFQALLFPCNILFFLMSGLFNIKESSLANLPRYFMKKARNILLPACVYMLLNTIYDEIRQPGPFNPQGVLSAFAVNVFSLYTNTVFWFVMAIFGMILVAPFFAKSFQNMDQRTAKSLLFLLFIFSGLNLVGVCAGTGFGWPWPLATFFTLFLLGPAINRMHVKSGVALSAFVACTIVSTVLLLNGVQHHPANDNTPFYFIAGISLYLLLKNVAEGMKGHSKAVSILAKYAFSIYMCHLMVMPYVIAFVPPPPWQSQLHT